MSKAALAIGENRDESAPLPVIRGEDAGRQVRGGAGACKQATVTDRSSACPVVQSLSIIAKDSGRRAM
ncbi:hypothetical protein CK221_06125 [Mesorhizobium sp. WSM3868]|nr:hypothetical protein CK221_06125 [Mesorhizobium sp. WSM3868]